MRRSITVIALVVTMFVSGCSTYPTPHGPRMADPDFCRGNGAAICLLGVGAMVAGVAFAASK